MSTRLARRSLVAAASALVLVVLPVSSAVARPTPNQFAASMQKALIAKAPSYHLSKAQITTAFKDATLRANLYSAGMVICQKLATETPAQAAADLVTLTTSLSNPSASGGSNQGMPVGTPTSSHQVVGARVFKGIVGVGIGVATAKGSLCPTQHAKGIAALKIYNKTVGAK